MRNFKFVLLALAIFSLSAFTACGKNSGSYVESVFPQDSSVVFAIDYSNEVQVEQFKKLIALFPQMKLLEKIQLFYDPGLPENSKYTNETFLNELLKPLLHAKWKVAGAVKVPEGFSFGQGFDVTKVELYLAGSFDEADKMQEMIEIAAEEDLKSGKLKHEEDGDVDYWQAEGFYLTRKDDLFFVTNTVENRKAALERVEDGSSIVLNKNFKEMLEELGDDNLGYLYTGKDFISKNLAELYQQQGRNPLMGLYDFMGESMAVWHARKDGLMIASSTLVDRTKPSFERIMGKSDQKVGLSKKVNGDGVFVYSQAPNMGVFMKQMVNSFVNSLMVGLNPQISLSAEPTVVDYYDEAYINGEINLSENVEAVGREVLPIESKTDEDSMNLNLLMTNLFGASDTALIQQVRGEEGEDFLREGQGVLRGESSDDELKSDDLKTNYEGDVYFGDKVEASANGLTMQIPNVDYYQKVIDQLAALSGLKVVKVEEILDSPFAYSVSDSASFVPNVAFYLELGSDEKAEDAKKLTVALDNYADQIIQAFDGLIVKGGEGFGALKKEVVLVNGVGLHKIYLDWDAFSEEMLAAYNVVPGFDIKRIVVELYYGVTADNVFVLALYPGFEKSYGKNVLENDPVFLQAKEKMGDNYGYMVSYFRAETFVKMLDRYVELVRTTPLVTADDLQTYEAITEGIKTIKYFMASGVIRDDRIYSQGFIKF